MNAKVMLVCDRDIMQLELSNMAPSVCETLLVTTIVSDWNTRAWTFFEAFRGRRALHLLCKDNAVVSLQQIIKFVNQRGVLDIEILLLAMPHFLPLLDDRRLVGIACDTPEQRQLFIAGYLGIETSGNLLSHRPASRPGDDVVIWSLLISDKTVFNNAEAFWRSMQGSAYQTPIVNGRVYSTAATIKTGYLVSSAPRLTTKGLGWAPATPTFQTSAQSDTSGSSGLNATESTLGRVTLDGLVADWLLWKFKTIDGRHLPRTLYKHNLTRIYERFLKGYRWGAILCSIERDTMDERWYYDSNRTKKTMVVICGTNDMNGSVVEKYSGTIVGPYIRWDENHEAVAWQWRGVYLWDDAEPLPDWRRVEKLLIA